METLTTKRGLRCAIYTRVSTDQGLEQDFNSLDAQREASEAYIKSQAHEGWRLVRDRFDDGGFSGGSMDRPALQKLLIDVQARRIDVIVVYKVDRLTRSLADFAKLVETFDAHGVSFVSVNSSFNTSVVGLQEPVQAQAEFQLSNATAIHSLQIVTPHSIRRPRGLGSGLSISWSGKRKFAG